MGSVKRIAVLGRDLYREKESNNAIRSFLAHCGLSGEGKSVELTTPIVPFSSRGHIIAPDARDCHALICRPTWGGQVTRQLIDEIRHTETKSGKNKKPFIVASLSAGTRPHIDDEIHKERAEFLLISSKGGNADQTAELTLALVLSVKRNVAIRSARMAFGIKEHYTLEKPHSLKDQTWCAIGAGDVVRSLLRKLLGMGLRRVVIWNRRMNMAYFEEVLRDLEITSWISRSESAPCAIIGAAGIGPSCVIQGLTGIDGLASALGEADVVSLHIPETETTEGFLDESKIGMMTRRPVVANMARHEIINEAHVMAALKDGKIQGYAADVLPINVEQGVLGHMGCLLWRVYMCNYLYSLNYKARVAPINSREELNRFKKKLAQEDLQYLEEPLNIVLTPHIGGACSDAEESISREVLGKLMLKLNLGTILPRIPAPERTGFTDFYTAPKEYDTSPVYD